MQQESCVSPYNVSNICTGWLVISSIIIFNSQYHIAPAIYFILKKIYESHKISSMQHRRVTLIRDSNWLASCIAKIKIMPLVADKFHINFSLLIKLYYSSTSLHYFCPVVLQLRVLLVQYLNQCFL